MFCWTRYRFHGNAGGSKPALNNSFDLFSENSVVRFFSIICLYKTQKILAYRHWSREILTERSSVI